MKRVIISTIGTSLLTNQINRGNPEEKDWYSHLRDTANLKETEIEPTVRDILTTLQQRATQQLAYSNPTLIRRASAELNGIYGIYQNNLNQGKEDIHFLIATDTAQGKTTATIVEQFLRQQGIANTSTYIPAGLSTASTTDFSYGIDELMVWLQQQIPPLRPNYQITFNLVGSFKSLQGYLNTIGMFYADEIIYIFEGENSELITIPRLPITVDTALIKPHAVNLALLEAGNGLNPQETVSIPEALLANIDNKIILSTWGQLIWNQCQEELLSQDLLPFPHLAYQDSFRADYNKIKNSQEKAKLQTTLAKVSALLTESNGDTSILKQESGLQYDKYTNKGDIDHFRVTLGLRVSCRSQQGKLLLYHYGKEEKVNNNPQ